VAKLGLPRPFTFGELVVAIERRRGRPLKVVERHLGTLPNTPCWSRTDGRRRVVGDQELDDENVGP
jgi:hypothetical protein